MIALSSGLERVLVNYEYLLQVHGIYQRYGYQIHGTHPRPLPILIPRVPDHEVHP